MFVLVVLLCMALHRTAVTLSTPKYMHHRPEGVQPVIQLGLNLISLKGSIIKEVFYGAALRCITAGGLFAFIFTAVNTFCFSSYANLSLPRVWRGSWQAWIDGLQVYIMCLKQISSITELSSLQKWELKLYFREFHLSVYSISLAQNLYFHYLHFYCIIFGRSRQPFSATTTKKKIYKNLTAEHQTADKYND